MRDGSRGAGSVATQLHLALQTGMAQHKGKTEVTFGTGHVPHETLMCHHPTVNTHSVCALGLLFSWISPRKKPTGRRAKEPGCAGLPVPQPCLPDAPGQPEVGKCVPPHRQGLPTAAGVLPALPRALP